MPPRAPADLVRDHLWIVEHFLARYGRFGSRSKSDLEAAGRHGLCEAAAKFEPKKGRVFSTYAWNWVKGYVLRELRKSHVVPVPEHTARKANAEGNPVRGVVVFGVADMASDEDQEVHSDRSMRLRALRAAVRQLEDKLARRVVRRALRGKSVAYIARALELPQTRVRELLESAERDLRDLMG